MKNKKDVYVVVDTPKKAKKLKNVLDMFREELNRDDIKAIKVGAYNGSAKLYTEYDKVYFTGFNWCFSPSGYNKTKVSIKELKSILAVEYLKVGDYFADCNKYIFVLNKINEDGTINCSCLTHNTKGDLSYEDFKRYATPEEIALLEGKKDKFAELKEAHKNGAVIEVKYRKPYNENSTWNESNEDVLWNPVFEHRIKPEEKKTLSIEEIEKKVVKFAESVDWDFDKVSDNIDTSDEVVNWEEYKSLKGKYSYGKTRYIFDKYNKPKVGDVVKAWGNESSAYTIGKVIEIRDSIGYFLQDDLWWDNAKTLTQQEAIDLLFKK